MVVAVRGEYQKDSIYSRRRDHRARFLSELGSISSASGPQFISGTSHPVPVSRQAPVIPALLTTKNHHHLAVFGLRIAVPRPLGTIVGPFDERSTAYILYCRSSSFSLSLNDYRCWTLTSVAAVIFRLSSAISRKTVSTLT